MRITPVTSLLRLKWGKVGWVQGHSWVLELGSFELPLGALSCQNGLQFGPANWPEGGLKGRPERLGNLVDVSPKPVPTFSSSFSLIMRPYRLLEARRNVFVKRCVPECA